MGKSEWTPNVRHGDNGAEFVAFHDDIPGVVAHGETASMAEENWQDALAMYVEHCQEHGLPLPHAHYTEEQFQADVSKAGPKLRELAAKARQELREGKGRPFPPPA